MPGRITTLIEELSARPRRLFLIDGLGACLTMLLLFVLGAGKVIRFGVPHGVMICLASIAGVYAYFSLSRYFYFNGKWQKELKGIILFNLGYCVVTAGLLVYYTNAVTSLGWIYFIAEIIVMLGLVVLEWKVLERSKSKAV